MKLIFGIPLITITHPSAVDISGVEFGLATYGTTAPQHTSNDSDAVWSVPPRESAPNDAFYISLLRSGEYIEYVSGLIKSNREFEILHDRLLAPLIRELMDDETLEDDVGPRLSTDSGPARDSISNDVSSPIHESDLSDSRVKMNSTYVVPEDTIRVEQVSEFPVVVIPSPRPTGPVRFDIKEDDYVLTIVLRIREIRVALKGIQFSDWMELNRSMKAAVVPVNYALFLLHTDVSRESKCSTQDCLDTREIIAQIHFRMVRLFQGVSRLEGSFAELLRELGVLKEALKGLWIGTAWMSEVFGGRCCRTSDQYAQGGISDNYVGQVPTMAGCLSSCSFRRTTTTTTTTISPTPSSAELERQRRLGVFLTDTSNELDNLLFEIGMVAGTLSGLEQAIASLRVKVMTKFLEIDRGIVAYSPVGYTLTTPRGIIARINSLCSTLKDVAHWPELRDGLVENIAAFRKELYRIRFENV